MRNQWPNSLDYAEAVQFPAEAFADPDPRAAEVSVDQLGLPRPCVGNFGDVYQFQPANGSRGWAVKCFTRPVARLKERYQEISRHLEQSRIPLTIGFKYLNEGILIRGEWYPVLKMEWVAGDTLRQYVQKNLGCPQRLEALYQAWLKVEPMLVKAKVAHGDLQHGNVMLVPGPRPDSLMLRLIDYDGMWVPALANQPPNEVGHQAFQHPQRARRNLYHPDVDRFPHLVIACSLKCLTRRDGLEVWERYDTGDNLLFKKEDFESPADLDLLHGIWDTQDAEMRALAGHLALAATSPLETTPPLSQLLTSGVIPPLTPEMETNALRVLG